MRHYYGTKTVLDWIFAHYFFGSRHHAWVAAEFYPYRRNNPRSSNPLLLYEEFYEAWRDRDDDNAMVAQKRLNLIKTINRKVNGGQLQHSEAVNLKDICNTTPIDFFYPLVYKIDISRIDQARLMVAGSGTTSGSDEFLITDLLETEFEVLFLDIRDDQDIRKIIVEVIVSGTYVDGFEVKEIIERRRIGDAGI